MLFRVQKDKDNPYVMLNKSFFKDENLSAKAKGILGYILTLPDDWQIYIDEVTTHFKDGKDSIRQGIKELIENQYIIRSPLRLRDEKGHLKGYTYDVFEVSTKDGKSNVGESNVGKSNTTNKLLKLNNDGINSQLVSFSYPNKIKEQTDELTNIFIQCRVDTYEDTDIITIIKEIITELFNNNETRKIIEKVTIYHLDEAIKVYGKEQQKKIITNPYKYFRACIISAIKEGGLKGLNEQAL